jgi:glycosyltransferase involved in cell wall biosynthesis
MAPAEVRTSRSQGGFLKVCIVSPEFPPTIGGIETYAHEYVRALKRLRPQWEVTVLTRPHPEGEVALPDIQVRPQLRRRIRLDRRLVRDREADVWHVMNAAYGWIAAEVPRVVVSVHGNDFLRPYLPLLRPDLARYLPFVRGPRWLDDWETALSQRRLTRLLRSTLPRAGCILTNSRYTERVLLDRFPECRGRTLPAMVGVAREFFGAARVERRPGDPVRLITISRVSEPRKNIDLVLRALAGLKRDHAFVYRIVGDGWDRPRLTALAESLGISDRVAFLGRVPRTQMIAMLAASDLFVLTSSVLADSHEGFGIAYLEANACGTPVLAARLGGAVEAVAEGESGMFVDQTSVEEIEGALRRFLRGEVRFSPDRCRRHADAYTWDKVVNAALPFYGA